MLLKESLIILTMVYPTSLGILSDLCDMKLFVIIIMCLYNVLQLIKNDHIYLVF